MTFKLKLTHSFPMQPFSTPWKNQISDNCKVFWCFKGVEKGCKRNEWGKWHLNYVDKVYYA